MKTVLTALKLVLADLAKLTVPSTATLVAGVAAPIVAKVLGADITPAEVVGWLAIVGGIAASLQKIITGQVAKAQNKK